MKIDTDIPSTIHVPYLSNLLIYIERLLRKWKGETRHVHDSFQELMSFISETFRHTVRPNIKYYILLTTDL